MLLILLKNCILWCNNICINTSLWHINPRTFVIRLNREDGFFVSKTNYLYYQNVIYLVKIRTFAACFAQGTYPSTNPYLIN